MMNTMTTATATGVNFRKTPFPWFGGKSKAAPLVWELLGDPHHYVEPFAGGMAVLLNRPHQANRTYYSETVNDIDGLLVNAWRAIQTQPDATAEAASNPVAEADLHARHVALIRWREERQLEHLMGDPLWCDPLMAGWWLWGICSWIGSQWCQTDHGPWWPDQDDRLTKWAKGDPDRPGVNRTTTPPQRQRSRCQPRRTAGTGRDPPTTPPRRQRSRCQPRRSCGNRA